MKTDGNAHEAAPSEPTAPLTKAAVWERLATVMDPEIPVLSLVDLGVIRDVVIEDVRVTVALAPTFSGCPALAVMQRDVAAAVLALGAASVAVDVTVTPPWSSDWITDEGRRKLREFGLAPPRRHGGNAVLTFFDVAPCPRCQSTNTHLTSSFGATLCRAMHVCDDCGEPFESIKAL